MNTKMMLVIRTNLLYLDINSLLDIIINDNLLFSRYAKEELLNRDLSTDIDNDKLIKAINKYTIEEIWNIILNKDNIDKKLLTIITIKLNQILDYYQQINLKDYLIKKNDGIVKTL